MTKSDVSAASTSTTAKPVPIHDKNFSARLGVAIAAISSSTTGGGALAALKEVGLAVHDVDLWDTNETFACVTINSIGMLGIDEDKVNVNAGAITLGHPTGASGARMIGAPIHEPRRPAGGLGVPVHRYANLNRIAVEITTGGDAEHFNHGLVRDHVEFRSPQRDPLDRSGR
jgi:acetyl-CoA acetyltransferase